MENEFYITLPSNVSSEELFPENTIANYRTKLAERVRLDGRWEVGLSEISFTNSWFNVSKSQTLTLVDPEKTYDNKQRVPAARYDDIEHLVRTLNSILKTYETTHREIHRVPQFGVEKESRKTYLRLGLTKRQQTEKQIYVRLGGEVAWMLGFRRGGRVDAPWDVQTNVYIHRISKVDPSIYHEDMQKNYPRSRSATVYDVNAGYHSIYAYTNIVYPNLVGNVNTQLLRVVAIPEGSKFGDQIVQTYQNPHYHPLMVKDFDTIEIDLKDETGKHVPFQFGRSILTLHFRRQN